MNPLRILPRFRAAYRALSELEQREQWSRHQIETFQLQRLNETWQHARKHVQHYAEMVRHQAIPERFSSLEEYRQTMPVLGKDRVRAEPQRFLSREHSAGEWFRTGGSTGDPLRVFWGVQAHRSQLRARYRMEQSFGVDFLDRKSLLWGHEGSFADHWLGRWQRFRQPIDDRLRQRLRLSAYLLDAQQVASHLERMRKFKPVSLYGYSSAIYVLAQQAIASDLVVDSLKLCVFTAEPAEDLFLATANKALHCPCAIEYGSVECGVMATGTPEGDLRVREDIVIIETVPEPCGRFAIIVSVLGNHSFPLLRYRIEDMTIAPIATPESGFSTLANVLGRDNDILRSRSGKWVHSMAIKHVLECDLRIRRFQVLQSSEGDLDVLVESTSTAKELNVSRLEAIMSDLVDGYPVRIDVSPQIAGNRAGKHRWIVSHMSRT